MLRFIVMLAMSFALQGTAMAACQSSDINALYNNERFSEAYELLRFCARNESLSSDNYVMLGDLIARGVGVYENRKLRSQAELFFLIKGAENGSAGGLESVISIFEYGELTLDLAPNREATDCLRKLESSTALPRDVSSCLPEELRLVVGA